MDALLAHLIPVTLNNNRGHRLELIHCALYAVAAGMGTITMDTSVLYEWGNRALLCGDLWTRVPGVIGYFFF